MESIRIGVRSWPVTMPSSYATRLDILVLSGTNNNRATFAAIGLCCPTLAKAIGVRPKSDLHAFGGEVLDGILEAIAAENEKRVTKGEKPIRVTVLDVVKAGRPLAEALIDGLIDVEEVEDAEGFSEPTPADSSA